MNSTVDPAQLIRCTRCVLPSTFPGLAFDESGICNVCNSAGSVGELKELRTTLGERIMKLTEDVKSKRSGEYDAVVALSGGKDSTYSLWLMKEKYGLKCLAVTIDNNFLSEAAIDNCKAISDSLNVDHIFYRPAFGFMKNMYQVSLAENVISGSAIKRASAVCNSCIGLINNHMTKVALQQQAPLIVGGYLGGQVPVETAVIELNASTIGRMRAATAGRFSEKFGPRASDFFTLPSHLANTDATITVVNPLLAEDYSQEDVIAKISGFGWVHPEDTGVHSSNCRLNDLGILAHYGQHGFHPYEPELADLVRKGLMGREAALGKVLSLPSPDDVKDVAVTLDVTIDGL